MIHRLISQLGLPCLSMALMLCGCSGPTEQEEGRSSAEILCDGSSSVDDRIEALAALGIEGIGDRHDHPATRKCVIDNFHQLSDGIGQFCRKRGGRYESRGVFLLRIDYEMLALKCEQEAFDIVINMPDEAPPEERRAALAPVQAYMCARAEELPKAILEHDVSSLVNSGFIDETQHDCLSSSLPAFRASLTESCAEPWESLEDAATPFRSWLRDCEVPVPEATAQVLGAMFQARTPE